MRLVQADVTLQRTKGFLWLLDEASDWGRRERRGYQWGPTKVPGRGADHNSSAVFSGPSAKGYRTYQENLAHILGVPTLILGDRLSPSHVTNHLRTNSFLNLARHPSQVHFSELFSLKVRFPSSLLGYVLDGMLPRCQRSRPARPVWLSG